MKRRRVGILLDATLALGMVVGAAACKRECAYCKEPFFCDRVAVRFQPGVEPNRIDEINRTLGAKVIDADPRTLFYTLSLPADVTPCDAIAYDESHDEVDYAAPDSEVYLLSPRE